MNELGIVELIEYIFLINDEGIVDV